MFNSKRTDFVSVNQAAHSDFAAELIKAAHDQGVKIALYYNMEDYYNPDYQNNLSH